MYRKPVGVYEMDILLPPMNLPYHRRVVFCSDGTLWMWEFDSEYGHYRWVEAAPPVPGTEAACRGPNGTLKHREPTEAELLDIEEEMESLDALRDEEFEETL